MVSKTIASLPNGFYNPISSPIKTIAVLKNQDKAGKGKPDIDIESLFLRLLVIRHRREMKLETMLTYEL